MCGFRDDIIIFIFINVSRRIADVSIAGIIYPVLVKILP